MHYYYIFILLFSLSIGKMPFFSTCPQYISIYKIFSINYIYIYSLCYFIESLKYKFFYDNES